MSRKELDFLGLAQRAGQVQSGDAASEEIIKKGKAKLVLVAKDASEGTKQRFKHLADYKKVPFLEGGLKEHLGAALGKSPRSVVVITDEGFARKLYKLFGGEAEDF